MAYGETAGQKISKLIRNPRIYSRKVFPFLKSKAIPFNRRIHEAFGDESLSKPYLGHKRLLALIPKRNGFFVEFGANDGYGGDPTYYLEKFRGWKGILIEPLSIGELARKNRKASTVYRQALVPFGYKGETVTFIDCNLMSFVKESIDNAEDWIAQGEKAQSIQAQEIVVPARTLQSVLDEHFKKHGRCEIDLVVADVEGYELEALKGLDFSKNAPLFILAECHDEERFSALDSFLSKHGYRFVEEIGAKDFLFKKTP